jgi:hypothetical protein
MHIDSAFRARGALAAFVAVFLLAVAIPSAHAQKDDGGTTGPPGIDHYLIYTVQPPDTASFPIVLRDQFPPQTTHIADIFAFFGNPVSKNNEPIVDLNLHYTWWHVSPPKPFSGSILASNQFGDQQLTLYDAEFLWNPALKNPSASDVQIPVANHYLCYRTSGSFVPRTVSLVDQFGQYQAVVMEPVWFCTPVEKTFHGDVFPILRPEANQVCYRIEPLTGFPGIGISYFDEFRRSQAFLQQQIWLCVPTFKHEITGADASSWGSVKAIYR